MHKLLTMAALAIASSSPAFAEPSQAFTQCAAALQQQKLAEAESVCAQARAEPGKDGQVIYGVFLARSGKSQDAIKVFSEALKGVDLSKPSEAEFAALRHRAFVRFLEKDFSADNDAHEVLKLAPDDVEMLQVGAQYSQRALQRLGYADKLIALEPKSAAAHLLRSYALSSNGRTAEAIAAADAAIKLEPNSIAALTARGYAHGVAEDYAKAEKDHAAVTRKAPQEPDPWINRGEMLVKLERYDDAIESAGKALSLRPDDVRALMLRANAHLSMGRPVAALADIEKVESTPKSWAAGNLREVAEGVRDAQGALTPQGVAAMEQDRSIILGGVTSLLHSKCGYFTVPSNIQDEPDNDGLHAYSDCLKQWRDTEFNEETQNSVGADALAAAERLENASRHVEFAEDFELLCSKKSKKAKCIDDALHARALASLDVFDDPRRIASNAEFDRLNRDIASYNAMVSRFNAASKTASFFQAVADALSSQ